MPDLPQGVAGLELEHLISGGIPTDWNKQRLGLLKSPNDSTRPPPTGKSDFVIASYAAEAAVSRKLPLTFSRQIGTIGQKQSFAPTVNFAVVCLPRLFDTN